MLLLLPVIRLRGSRRRRGRCNRSESKVRVGERQRPARRNLELALGAVGAALPRPLEGRDAGPEVEDVLDRGLEEAGGVELLARGRGDEVAEAVESICFFVEVDLKWRRWEKKRSGARKLSLRDRCRSAALPLLFRPLFNLCRRIELRK